MVTQEQNTSHLSDKEGFGNRFNHDIVRLDYDWEVIYWCRVLLCTKEELESAVKSVGNSAEKIRAFIKN